MTVDRHIRILYILYLHIICTDIGSICCCVVALLHRIDQRKVFDLDVGILLCVKALGKLIFLEVYADLYRAFCRLYFYFLLCYIAVFILLFYRIDEGHIVQKGVLVGVLFFCIRIRRCCCVVVQSVHVSFVIISRAVFCDRRYTELCVIRNCLRVIEGCCYAYQIILVGIFSLGRILAGFIDLLGCSKVLVFLLRR